MEYLCIDHRTPAFSDRNELQLFIDRIIDSGHASYLYPPDELFYDRVLDKETYKIFAIEHNKIIGFSALQTKEQLPHYFLNVPEVVNKFSSNLNETGFVWFNLVSPEYRGRNIGQTLLKMRLEVGVQEMGCKHFIATAHPDNTPSLRILENNNFICLKETHLFKEHLPRKIMTLDV